MSPTTDEGDNQTKCVLRDLARDMASKKWLFGKWLSDNKTKNAFTVNDLNTATMVRLRQSLSRDPDTLRELFDMFASEVFNRSSDNNTGDIMAAFRCLLLSAITEVRSFDALRARMKATTVDIPTSDLIENLLKKIDDDGGGGGLNFRSAQVPSCVVAAVGPRLPQNSFTFAMSPRCGYNDGGHGEGLFVCVPVTNATGAYGTLAGWPTSRRVGVAEDQQVALNTVRWIDSWGIGRYRSVLVFNARRSAFYGQLPYEIRRPQYLVVCEEQTRAKMALHLGRLCSWKPWVLGAVVLVGGYMTHRYRVSAN